MLPQKDTVRIDSQRLISGSGDRIYKDFYIKRVLADGISIEIERQSRFQKTADIIKSIYVIWDKFSPSKLNSIYNIIWWIYEKSESNTYMPPTLTISIDDISQKNFEEVLMFAKSKLQINSIQFNGKYYDTCPIR